MRVASSPPSVVAVSAKPRRRSGLPQPKLYGSETPRVGTPLLRDLTEDTSLGFECIRFTQEILGIDLMPWQRWFLIHALELHPDEVGDDGSPLFRFRKVFLLVGRQNGKSTVMQALTLWRMFVDRCSLVIGTAQDLEVAESLLRESYELAEDVDELKSEMGPLMRGAGKMSFRLKSGETYKVKAASRRGGRGLSGELVLLDELREHQSWDAWGAVTKTTNAKERAQIYGVSNAGDASSVVLRHFRKKAHERLGDPDGLNADPVGDDLLSDELAEEMDVEVDDSLGWFEWSAPPGCDIRDREGWRQADPALGWRIRETTLASDAANDPEWVFRTEVLCQWSEGSLEGPFPPGSWESCLDDQSQIAADSPVVWALDVSWDRSTAHIAVAGLRGDGLPHVEPVASRAGTDWVVAWFTDADHPDRATRPIALQTTGAPVSSLAADLETAGLTVVPWTGSDLGRACGSFYDAVRAGVLRHRVNPILDVAAATASTRPFGDSWLWDRKKSATDISPLVAATGALWCLTNGIPPPPKRSKYEDAELVVV